MGDDGERGSEQQTDQQQIDHEKRLKDRKVSWEKLNRIDSFNLEAGQAPVNHNRASQLSWKTTLSLAFQSIGVVYGDIGTSPMYVYANTFTDGIKDKNDIIGVLSLIIYTLTFIPLLKYAFIILFANDQGEGGTFAMYSLLCRYAKIGLVPNQEPEDKELSNYKLQPPTKKIKRAHKIKEKLEKSRFAQIFLFFLTIMGTSMVLGDGVLTPSISVLSAVDGIKGLGQEAVVGVSVAILILLFSFQRFGTDKVGFSFAPIIILWFSFLAGIGLYSLFKYDIGVLRAFNPLYIIDYFKRNGKKGWISLGGIFLCIKGTEAMFADLGHFNVRAIQISFSFMTFPALMAIYSGQAAYLTKHPENVANTFYASVPDPLYWPTFIVAVAAAIIASQAMISGAFSIVWHSLCLGCFPRVKIVHTSTTYKGQIYIPEINYAFMLACVLITASFQTTENIGHAYGITVVLVMMITTAMVSLIMLIIWKTSIWCIAAFLMVFGTIEALYFSSVIYKFTSGGFLPLVIAVVMMSIMGIWHYVHALKYQYELNKKVSSEFTREQAYNLNVNRIPGIGLLYSELVHGITPLFSHYISSIPSVHSVFILVSIKSLPISTVTLSERFLFRYVEPRDFRMFRCVVRYGYKDNIEEPHEFECLLFHYLKEFINLEYYVSGRDQAQVETAEPDNNVSNLLVEEGIRRPSSTVHAEDAVNEQPSKSRTSSASYRSSGRITPVISSSNKIASGPIQLKCSDDIEFVEKEREKGVVYLMGEVEIMAANESSLFKKFIINNAYNFMKKNSRDWDKALAIPRANLLKIGMTYEI